MLSIAEWTDRALALSSPMKLTSSASFSPSIRISLRLKIHQAQAKNFCRVLDIRVSQGVHTKVLDPRFVAELISVGIQVIDFYITKASIVKGIIRKWKNRIEEHIFDNKLRTAAMYNSIITQIASTSWTPAR